VLFLVFLLEFVVPGDPVASVAPKAHDPVTIARIRHDLHLDDPLTVQLKDYVSGVVHGDLGTSYVRNEPVATAIGDRLPATAVLAAAGLMVEITLGLALGIWAATRRTGRKVAVAVSVTLTTVPPLVMGLLLLLVFGYTLKLVPVLGGVGPAQLILPAIALGFIGVPYYAQIVSEELTTSFASPYVRSAVARGLTNRRIIRRHVLRNVAGPTITIAALDLATYCSGVVIIEAVFGWPGVGQLAVQSVGALDRPMILGITLLTALVVCFANLAADLLRTVFDPRTRARA
jgi:ABC-type dipeptide/oligopeptide/nickel transport system permease component